MIMTDMTGEDAMIVLDAALAEMIPDPISIREFVDESNIIVATTTNRMFLVTATDDGAFSVTELDATQFMKES